MTAPLHVEGTGMDFKDLVEQEQKAERDRVAAAGKHRAERGAGAG